MSEVKQVIVMRKDLGMRKGKMIAQFHGVPTKTCLGIGPWWSSEIDKITGSLPLL